MESSASDGVEGILETWDFHEPGRGSRQANYLCEAFLPLLPIVRGPTLRDDGQFNPVNPWDVSCGNLFDVQEGNSFLAPLCKEEISKLKLDVNSFIDISTINANTLHLEPECASDQVKLERELTLTNPGHNLHNIPSYLLFSNTYPIMWSPLHNDLDHLEIGRLFIINKNVMIIRSV